jgi:hypothetical protein
MMNAHDINRDNLGIAVSEVLDECLTQLDEARDERIVQDLRVAVEALQGIKAEIRGQVARRPKGLRTGLFIRYAIDFDDQLALDAELKKKVVRIEDVYKRI